MYVCILCLVLINIFFPFSFVCKYNESKSKSQEIFLFFRGKFHSIFFSILRKIILKFAVILLRFYRCAMRQLKTTT